jgi:hypothetical protein
MKFSVLTLLIFVLIFTIASAEEKETNNVQQGDCTAPKSKLVVFILSLLLGELAGLFSFFV